MPGGMLGVEETGCIGEVVQSRGGALHWVYRLNGDPLPANSQGFDGLIVFGGEIGAHEEEHSPYFDHLFALIRTFHGEKKPVFGSCLGAQCIACAFGGEAMPQGFFEFGFSMLELETEARSDPLLSETPHVMPLFEMHNDTFSLPPEAVRLMRGDKVPNQIFRVGTTTYAFQCHFEATADIAHIWKRREVAIDPSLSKEEAAKLYSWLDREFELHGSAQREFGLRVMNRWMDLFSTRT